MRLDEVVSCLHNIFVGDVPPIARSKLNDEWLHKRRQPTSEGAMTP